MLETFCFVLNFFLDNKFPIFSDIPSDVSVMTDYRQPTAVVDWTKPTVYDDSGNVTLVVSADSGSQFNIGTTCVTYTAQDMSKNKAFSTFIVTVRGTLLIGPTELHIDDKF